MYNSKLFDALKLLSAEDIKTFRLFVQSPYFNKHERLSALADIVVEGYPKFDGEGLDKKELYRQLFPGEHFNGQKVSDLFTYMYRLLLSFLAYENYSRRVGRQELDTLAGLRDRNMDKFFERRMDKASVKRQNPEGLLSDESLLQQYHLAQEADLYFTRQDSRTYDTSLEDKSARLDEFYMVAKLRQACEAVNRQNIIQQQYDIRFVDTVNQMVELQPELKQQVPAIDIYQHILLTLTQPEEEAGYFRLIELLQEHQNRFGTDELRSMYDYAQNYCIKKINTGKTDFVAEIFRLYQLLLANGVIFIDDELSQWDYKNIVTVGTRLKEYEWTEQFIDDYKDRLPEENRLNAYTYNLANYYYSRQLYDRALELLRDVEFTDLYYGLGARSLLLKIYYEAEEYDPLYSLFDSFKVYLKRHKLISEYQYRAHFNLVRFTKYMTDLRLRLVSANKETLWRDLSRIKQRINIAGEITNASWLNQQIVIFEASIGKPKPADVDL